jgi:glutamate--cysteine ligase
MIKASENLITKILDYTDVNFLLNGKIGIEKESMRVNNNKISHIPHHKKLGSSLFNRYITTDFSEAQLEFITPPFEDNESGLDFLINVHHFVSKNIRNEYLWPLSMPPHFESEKEIPIASFGNSSLAIFKETYRKGLSHRYGRGMQAISGIHFNYSLSEELWKSDLFKNSYFDETVLKNNIYMRTIRNLIRFNWLVLYLYGCSPIINSSFRNNSHKFQKLNKRDYFLPYATTLRMSDIGYKNSIQANLSISFNEIENYITGLKKATQKKYDDFEKIYRDTNDIRAQLNSSIIQNEDEYYAIARPKSNLDSEIRMLNKLQKGGIDYIELRSVDLNPFNSIGIDEEIVNFLEIFMIFATFSPSKKMTHDEYMKSYQNDLDVSLRGREPNLHLLQDDKRVSLKSWGLEIIDSMVDILESMHIENHKYLHAVGKAKEKLLDIDKTPSAILLKTIKDENIEMLDFGCIKGEEYKNQYLQKSIDKNLDWKSLEKEARDSLSSCKNASINEKLSFDQYMKEYYK